MTSGISVYLGRLFKLDKCCGRQREEGQSSFGGVLSQHVGGMSKVHSQLSAVVILMLHSQTNTRSAWVQKYLNAKDIFHALLWGVRGICLIKGLLGQGCQRK